MKAQKPYISRSFSELPLCGKNLYTKNANPKKIIKEVSNQSVRFNVMPDRYVDENILVKEYRLWDNAIESIFDRDYHTDMINSPNHLTFLSSLVNLQKMVYIFMHQYLDLEYKKDGEELIKVWPGKLNIDMPKMVLKRENISHLMIIDSVSKIKENRYKVSANTFIDEAVRISGQALIVVL